MSDATPIPAQLFDKKGALFRPSGSPKRRSVLDSAPQAPTLVSLERSVTDLQGEKWRPLLRSCSPNAAPEFDDQVGLFKSIAKKGAPSGQARTLQNAENDDPRLSSAELGRIIFSILQRPRLPRRGPPFLALFGDSNLKSNSYPSTRECRSDEKSAPQGSCEVSVESSATEGATKAKIGGKDAEQKAEWRSRGPERRKSLHF